MKAPIKICLLLIFFTGLTCAVKAQFKDPEYLIYKTPLVIGKKTIDSLNRAISYLKNEDDVFETIDRKLNRFHNLVIHVKKKHDAKTDEYIDYYIGDPKRMVRDFREKTGSRDGSTLIYYKAQLRSFFPDTLFVIDTLKIGLRPADFNYSIHQYYLRVYAKKKVFTIPVQSMDNRLLIAVKPPFECGGRPLKTVLYNHQSQAPLASFYLAFFDQAQKDELLNISLCIRVNNPNNPGLSTTALAQYLLGYARLTIGPVKLNDIEDWLNKQP